MTSPSMTYHFSQKVQAYEEIVLFVFIYLASTVCVKLEKHNRISQWTFHLFDKVFKNLELRKYFITAWKSILYLVKLQSLVAQNIA